MTTITLDLLKAVAPEGSNLVNWISPLQAATTEFGITTPARIASFLAQLAHESGGFKWMHEIWGPTETQKTYERNFALPWSKSEPGNHKAFILGNELKGDGFKFRGHGPIQITGRRNTAHIGARLNLPLLDHPELLEDPVNGARSAALYWFEYKCNELADANDFVGITRQINGGTNGLEDRTARWNRAKEVLGI